ncbi:YpmS family protein [Alkalicoccus luteus]|uniref:YpmS family protein n=1 Tax=Alkalicoccus luteus TaxID=1237094 RepID=A0A969PLW3_9BACI|nr:YpmS family protein [Alkalicoccus luteus]NJP36597.1 YpmS family protein [Alkalicoccus luteus]
MNRWKIAFNVLLAAVLIMTVGGWLWLNHILTAEPEETFSVPDREIAESPSLTVTTTREDANSWLQRELDEEETEEFDLYLEDAVYFTSEFSLFGINIPVEVQFQPEVDENGNIWLYEDGFRAGGVDLPAAQVFQLIGDSLDLPEWIEPVPEEAALYMDFAQLDTGDTSIYAEAIDLPNDELRFRITPSD